MSEIIPVDQTSLYYDELLQLDGVEYLFTFIWSSRESCWYLEIGDQDGNALASGIRLVSTIPLLRRFNDSRLPPGNLLLTDEIIEPTDLGGSALLVYVPVNG